MNIDKIDVLYNEIRMSLLPNELKVVIDNNRYDITKEEIESLIRIIRVWPNNLSDDSLFDGLDIHVVVYANNEVTEYNVARAIPRGFEEFDELIRGIYDRRNS